MKNILIVGGTGFLGFHLAKNFIKDFNVISISSKKPKKNRKINKVKYYKADISKMKNLKRIEKKLKQIDFIINLGGYVMHNDKIKVKNSHFIGVKNLINFFLKKKIGLFIQIGSSMEYGKVKSPQKENYDPKPISFYGKAKLSATHFAQKISANKNFPIVILRLYQVYGPYQDTNRIIPFVIDQSLKKKVFPCSSGEQKRDFLYIDDFVNCIKIILKTKKLSYGEILNVGYGKSYKIKDLINFISKKIKSGKPNFGKIPLRNEENEDTYPDIKKIKKFFNWKPKTSLYQGLKLTVKFYKKRRKI